MRRKVTYRTEYEKMANLWTASQQETMTSDVKNDEIPALGRDAEFCILHTDSDYISTHAWTSSGQNIKINVVI